MAGFKLNSDLLASLMQYQQPQPASGVGGYGDLSTLLPQGYGLNPNAGGQTGLLGDPNMLGQVGLGASTPGGGSFLDGMIGTEETPGWGGMALGTLQGIGNAFMGMKQYGMAKDALAEGKRQFEMNFGAQRQTTNTALEDRQRARVASNPGAYESVGTYMNQNGIR